MVTENLLAKKCRPNSLNISTPTKLITLEEARSKHLPNKNEEGNYIEVGGGPKNLPKMYHTIIDLPPGKIKNYYYRILQIFLLFILEKTRIFSLFEPSLDEH